MRVSLGTGCNRSLCDYCAYNAYFDDLSILVLYRFRRRRFCLLCCLRWYAQSCTNSSSSGGGYQRWWWQWQLLLRPGINRLHDACRWWRR